MEQTSEVPVEYTTRVYNQLCFFNVSASVHGLCVSRVDL